ncbi:MAG: CDGSH iron-sulfur domain-containing protein [Pseudomonadaceae bacterium]|nr:CDGSH iron-sulfur domain-containing protein [Pseudomonadaceae bacterium]
MNDPVIVQKAPFPVDVKEGQKLFWCSCGKSQRQPFCDGSHQGSEFVPVAYEAEADRTLYFCGCKHSKSGALCDGSHNAL